jgi:hypothetical protein
MELTERGFARVLSADGSDAAMLSPSNTGDAAIAGTRRSVSGSESIPERIDPGLEAEGFLDTGSTASVAGDAGIAGTSRRVSGPGSISEAEAGLKPENSLSTESTARVAGDMAAR